MVALSFLALLTAISGYLSAPQTDEGAGAHIFQLAIVALVPTIVIFLASANWAEPWQQLRFLAIPGALLAVAISAVYYLEHYYWPGR
jgi:hypothetical protein